MNLEFIYPRSPKFIVSRLNVLVRGRLWLKVLIGMAAGVAAGMLLGPSAGLIDPGRAHLIGNWLAFPGQLFLASLQMIVVPLVFASIIRGIASCENTGQLKQTGIKAVIFFVVTTIIAALIGIAIATLIKPGLY